MNASFEERSVWIQLAAVAISLGAYFVIAWRMFTRGIDVLVPYVPLFFGAVLAMALILVIGHVVAALFGKCEAPDERDRLIHWRSESESAWVLVVGMFAALTCLVFSLSSVMVAHVLLMSLFVTQLFQFGLQIRYYRGGV
jgi:hypothetical protein